MQLNDKEKLLINDLCNIAWVTGQVKSPAMANDVEALRAKLVRKDEETK